MRVAPDLIAQVSLGGQPFRYTTRLDAEATENLRPNSQFSGPVQCRLRLATLLTEVLITHGMRVTGPGGNPSRAPLATRSVPAWRVYPAGWKRRSRRLLVTTNTELKAMAAPAISGDSKPRAASGIAAAL